MKKVNKKLVSVLIIMACVIIGGTLSFESLARFSKKFADNQTISTDKFKVDVVNTFKDLDKIVPGDNPIAEDTITLSNDNDYPVEFTVKLKSENKVADKNLLEYLKLIITIDNETEEAQNEYIIRLNPGDKKIILATVEWKLDENGEVDANIAEEATVEYSYDIKAKQLSNDESSSGGTGENPDGNDVSIGDSSKVKVLTLNNINWNLDTEAEKNNVEIYNDYTIVKGKVDINLDNFNVNLNEENLTFNSDIELLQDSSETNKGINFSIGFKGFNNIIKNRLTYQLYSQGKIYGRVACTNSVITPDKLIVNDGKIIKSSEVKLKGEIYKEDDLVYANIAILDKDGNKVTDKRENYGNYKTTDKLYLYVNDIIGGEGIKIKSMELKAINKI